MTAGEWKQTDTLVVLALMIGIAMGTCSGYMIPLDLAVFTVDNKEVE